MNTKILMMATSLLNGLIGALMLFAPDEVVRYLGNERSDALIAILQLMGGMFIGKATLNWTAKDFVIGGIFSRPLTLGNFTHFLVGSLVLLKCPLLRQGDVLCVAFFALYSLFAIAFGYLVFGLGAACKSKAP